MTEDIKYFYLRDPKIKNRSGDKRMVSERVLTVARKLGKNGNKIHYQVALCTPVMKWIPDGATVLPRGDAYSKTLGRTIATGRLKSKPFKVSISDDADLGGSMLKAVLENISKNKEIPQSARRMVKCHLKSVEFWAGVGLPKKADRASYGKKTVTVAHRPMPEHIRPLTIEVWENNGKGKRTKVLDDEDNFVEVPNATPNSKESAPVLSSPMVATGTKPTSTAEIPLDRVMF